MMSGTPRLFWTVWESIRFPLLRFNDRGHPAAFTDRRRVCREPARPILGGTFQADHWLGAGVQAFGNLKDHQRGANHPKWGEDQSEYADQIARSSRYPFAAAARRDA